MLDRFRRDFRQRFLASFQLNLASLRALLLPFGRPPPVRRHAAAVIVARVQLVAALFAVLVPLAAVVDLLVFDAGTAARLAVLRLLSSAVFVALAWPRELSTVAPYRQAMLMLLALLLVPPLFHLFSAAPLATAAGPGPQLLARLYGYLPTVVLGGLAVFPLTALETALLALPVIALGALAFAIQGVGFSLLEQGDALWFMFMLLGVAAFSGMCQCHYMATLALRAMHDPLTGAYTRQSGEDALSLLYRLGEMAGKPLSVVFIDLDRFKAINDGYGHEAGDRALRELAERLRRGLRRADFLIRWGGEEFLAVLPDTPPANVPGLFRRLRAQGFGERPDGTPLTASIGVAGSDEAGIAGWPALVALADQRMYAAKQGGRDAIVVGDGKVENLSG